jgi:hypothetical protein
MAVVPDLTYILVDVFGSEAEDREGSLARPTFAKEETSRENNNLLA